VFDQAMEKREPRLEKEILNCLGLHQAILFYRNRPTLVRLVRYFAPDDVRHREPASEVPRLPKTPRQPVALTDYVREKQIEAAKVRAEKAAEKTDKKEEPPPPRPPGRPRGSGRRPAARTGADRSGT
jgi:hypothetical protein